ncbi:hypothetical protein LUZ60_005676 [Juncus effusus]|nr:hypothetical protein LUZ60_005676 [Juncus effusus]
MRKRCSSSRGRLVRNQVSEEDEQIDRLSNLPESLLLLILSLLPIPVAACTSVLSRRFHQIWEATHLIERRKHYYPKKDDCGLLRHDPSYPLFHLIIYTHYTKVDHLISLLNKAQSLGLRHLTIDLSSQHLSSSSLPIIFSFNFLLSLSISGVTLCDAYFVPSIVSLTHLKSLSLCLRQFDFVIFNEIVSRLYSLEDLFIELNWMRAFNLTCVTVRKLEITIKYCESLGILRLSMPNLEYLDIKISHGGMPHFSSEIPQLKKAFFSNDLVRQCNVPAICVFLKNMMNVESLKLDLTDHWEELHPFNMILDPDIEPPIFPNLKSLDLKLCVHDENMVDLIRLLQNCPVLESLKLIHKGPNKRRGSRSLFRSRLPRNADGNYQHACFQDLQIEEKRRQLIELLTKKSPQRVKI